MSDPAGRPRPSEEAATREVMRMARGGRAGDRRLMAGSAAGFTLHQIAEVAVPVLIGVGVQAAADDAPPAELAACLLALVGVFATLISGWRVGLLNAVRLSTRVEHRLRRSLMDTALGAPVRDASRLISIATADVDRVGTVAIVFGRGIAAVAALAASLAVLLVVSWPLALVILAVAAVQLVTVDRIGRRLESRVALEQRELGEATAQAADLLAGVRVLHGIGGAAAAAERYRVASRRALVAARARVRAQTGVTAIGSGIAAAAFALTAALAAVAGSAGSISPGDLVTVVGVAAMLPIPLSTLVGAAVETASARGAAARVAGVLDDARLPDDLRGSEADDLCIRSRGAEISVRRGELVGLRADTRTALALADAVRDGGDLVEVLADGAPVVGPRSRRAVLHAPPHPDRVFTGSLAENLFAEADAELLEVAAVDDVLAHLHAGVDSSLGEQGRRLSGGQRQRVLLARALHQPQPFLLLHEPLSSVDALTAERVVRSLRGLARTSGRGIVLSTTQPRLLAFCDRVTESDPAGQAEGGDGR